MPSPFCLTNLPVEVLLEVVEQAKQHQTLQALRLVNRLFNVLVSPVLFTKIVLRLSSDGLKSSLGLLHAVYATGDTTSISRHVKELVVDRSNEFEDPTSRSSTFPLPTKVDPGLRQEFDILFTKAVYCLNGLRTLRVLSGYDDTSTIPISSIWNALKDHDIPLRDIYLSGKIDQAFLDYLGSYTGIETLHTRGVWASRVSSVDRSMSEAFTRSLLRHQGSLRRLTVIAEMEGPWSLGRHGVRLDGFDRLEGLVISVNPEDVAMTDDEMEFDAITWWISVAHDLPSLHTISFNMVEYRSLNRWNPVRYTDRHVPLTIRLMLKRVSAFKAAAYERQSPDVCVYGQVFKMGSDNRYQASLTEEEARERRWKRIEV
ncbi:hypothetical protein AAF712_007690 [Marasmius tenuissimus]|uniref:F-box domain-containing protein n=1 Tax=Marasmius tenuissimus TaxID=585030 RepID=A0ABR2ZVL1_9AGAR